MSKGIPTKANSPRRIRSGEPAYGKKAMVVRAVKNGESKTIRFGDPNMPIRKSNPSAKKSYCARSSGIKGAGDKHSANYWSRRAWDC